eukprot:403370282
MGCNSSKLQLQTNNQQQQHHQSLQNTARQDTMQGNSDKNIQPDEGTKQNNSDSQNTSIASNQHPVNKKVTAEEANEYYKKPQPGKYEIVATKPMNNQRDLSLAYSPGVAFPCLEINKNPQKAYDYTNKSNIVAVVSNGTAVLGLGNLGALAGKPVMEGKAVLFQKFAGVQSVDICVDAYTIDEFVNCVRYLGPSFAGINLEDIRGPDCFEIEARLQKLMNIPVFHDDQHGTAIICLAGLINAIELSGKSVKDIKLVCNGAGAAGIACGKLIQSYGVKKENCLMVDTKAAICCRNRQKNSCRRSQRS